MLRFYLPINDCNAFEGLNIVFFAVFVKVHGMNTHKLLESLNWRYAVKKFDATKKISAEIWATLEDALVLTPSSFGLQPWKFVVITDPTIKEKLKSASWNQHQVVDASHVVAFLAKKNLVEADVDRLVEQMEKTRGTPPAALEGMKKVILGFTKSGIDVLNWNTRQVYIALGQFMVAAAALNVDTCPMEGIVPAQYDEILNLKNTDYTTVVACVAGYRAPDDKYASLKKVRYAKSDVIVNF